MIKLVGTNGPVVSATAEPDPGDPVFTGHYPGFPILPGLYLVEYVHATVCAAQGNPTMRPEKLDRVKFLRPVYSGDKLTIEAELDAAGDELRCRAKVFVQGRPVADVRLRYRGGRA
jgi:3-hydroxyacyl-[acyl-carrier-protein] dehydratase